jgi:serine/threonine protein phosphatase PrpC
MPVQEGDVFLLCSDGLHGVVKQDELLEVAQLPIAQAASEFVRRALDRGAPDNVTVIVAKVVREGDTSAEGEDTLVEKADVPESQRDTAPLPPVTAKADASSPSRWAVVAVLLVGAAGAWVAWTTS